MERHGREGVKAEENSRDEPDESGAREKNSFGESTALGKQRRPLRSSCRAVWLVEVSKGKGL